jgi:hypothetical protein
LWCNICVPAFLGCHHIIRFDLSTSVLWRVNT